METVNVALELCRAAQMWPTEDDEVGTFTEKLVKAVNKLSESEFYGMPAEAQTWIDEAIECANAELPFPELDGYAEVIAMNGAAKPEARVAKPKGDGEERRNAKKRSKSNGERKPRQLARTGIVATVGEALINNPDATIDDIRKIINAKGMEASTSSVPTFRSAFRNFLSVLKRSGHTDLDVKY